VPGPRRPEHLPSRWPRNPTRDVVPIIVVFIAKLRAQRWLFIPDDKEMESDGEYDGVESHDNGQEEPRLPYHDEEGSNVHRVANPSIRPGGNESSRCIPRAWCTTPDGREDPKAAEVQSRTKGDNDDRVPGHGASDWRCFASGSITAHTRLLRPADDR